jgi:hypothetical protein
MRRHPIFFRDADASTAEPLRKRLSIRRSRRAAQTHCKHPSLALLDGVFQQLALGSRVAQRGLNETESQRGDALPAGDLFELRRDGQNLPDRTLMRVCQGQHSQEPGVACQGKVEMSPFWQSRNVPFSLGL